MLFQPFTALNSECIWGLLMSSGLAIFHWTFIWPMFANMASLQSSFSGCDLCLTFYNNHYWSILLNKVPADTETHQTNDMTKIKDFFGIMIRVQVPGLNASVADLNLKMLEYKQIILFTDLFMSAGRDDALLMHVLVTVMVWIGAVHMRLCTLSADVSLRLTEMWPWLLQRASRSPEGSMCSLLLQSGAAWCSSRVELQPLSAESWAAASDLLFLRSSNFTQCSSQWQQIF